MISRERVKKMYSHYRKRMKKRGIKENDNWHALRTTGSPCSCYMCSGEKYNRKEKHKGEMIQKELEAL
jgi:hypothetical protein